MTRCNTWLLLCSWPLLWERSSTTSTTTVTHSRPKPVRGGCNGNSPGLPCLAVVGETEADMSAITEVAIAAFQTLGMSFIPLIHE